MGCRRLNADHWVRNQACSFHCLADACVVLSPLSSQTTYCLTLTRLANFDVVCRWRLFASLLIDVFVVPQVVCDDPYLCLLCRASSARLWLLTVTALVSSCRPTLCKCLQFYSQLMKWARDRCLLPEHLRRNGPMPGTMIVCRIASFVKC